MRAALDNAVVTLRLPSAMVATVVATIVSAIVAAVISTVIAAMVSPIVTSVVSPARWGLRWRGVASSGRSGVLLAAPGALRPGVATLARRLRRVFMTRSAAALLVVPVPVVLRAITRARRRRRGLRSSVIEAAAELSIPELVAFAAIASFNCGLCGHEADKSCGEDNNTSEGFHLAADSGRHRCIKDR